ncbi:MAG: hypothetical protein JXR36_13255 [Bacteroidales bacterium]|nr:hypothetical protein [Bacteroidales bacterium]
MKTLISICLIFLGLPVFTQTNTVLKKQMFCTAIQNLSTSPYYVVINVKNHKTGSFEELCIDTHSLSKLININKYDCDKNSDLQFEFDEKTLDDLYTRIYTREELKLYEDSIKNLDLWPDIKTGKTISKVFKQTEFKQQIMFAHILFNNGFMVSRSCLAGNIINFITYENDIKPHF